MTNSTVTTLASMRPVVLCFSGLDPSGGAGLQADIEAIGMSGAHAAIACTALTIQNSQQVTDFDTCDARLVKAQALAVLDDLPIRAIKSGMMGSVANIEMLTSLFKDKLIPESTPYVLDPVLVANRGGSLGDKSTLVAAFEGLLPYATLVTPNTYELRALSNKQDLHEAAKLLCDKGTYAVLIKTSHDHTSGDIEQFLYIEGQMVYRSVITRLQGEFHGSGCTLASYLAGNLAQREQPKHTDTLISAVKAADIWMHRVLAAADRPHPDIANAQLIPNRFVDC